MIIEPRPLLSEPALERTAIPEGAGDRKARPVRRARGERAHARRGRRLLKAILPLPLQGRSPSKRRCEGGAPPPTGQRLRCRTARSHASNESKGANDRIVGPHARHRPLGAHERARAATEPPEWDVRATCEACRAPRAVLPASRGASRRGDRGPSRSRGCRAPERSR